MQAAFLFTVVGTTGFIAVIAGQLPGVNPSNLFFFDDTRRFGKCWCYFLYTDKINCWTWIGLGILCALLSWEHLIGSFSRGKRFTGVRKWLCLLKWCSLSYRLIPSALFACRLLQAAISGFSTFFPDYQERIAAHEAAHFLGTFVIVFVFGLWKCFWLCLNFCNFQWLT